MNAFNKWVLHIRFSKSMFLEGLDQFDIGGRRAENQRPLKSSIKYRNTRVVVVCQHHTVFILIKISSYLPLLRLSFLEAKKSCDEYFCYF